MTLSVKAVFTATCIEPLDKSAFNEYKRNLKDSCGYQRLTIEPWDNRRGDNAFRFFHALRDRYAEAMGYSKPYAKTELKSLYGVIVSFTPDFIPPKRTGRFVEMYGEITFQITTLEYTKAEMMNLTEGTKQACYDNSINISNLEKEYGT